LSLRTNLGPAVLLVAAGCVHGGTYSRLPPCAPPPPASASPVDAHIYDSTSVTVRPKRIGGKPVHYPEDLKRARISGEAIVEVVIDARGYPEPGSVVVIGATYSAFGAAAARAITESCYSPGLRDGQPVRVRLAVPIKFWVTAS